MRKWAFLIMAAALAGFPCLAFADSTPFPPIGWTGTYKVESPDNQYVLVMLGSMPVGADEVVSPETAELNKLVLKYPASGLYRNDGSEKPLWTMPYLSWPQTLTLSSDGRHLVVWGGWPSNITTYRDDALTFYEDGLPIKRYMVNNLVMDPEALPHSVSHYQWMLDSSFDDAQGLLAVETHNHEKYVFDIKTGKVASAIIPTVTPKNHVDGRVANNIAAVSTSIPENIAPAPAAYGDQTMAAGLLLSAGSLTIVFTGVSLLSIKARRTHCKRSD